jgi:rod shape-determining protein MreC
MTGIGWRLVRGRGASKKQWSLAVCGVLAVVVAFLGKAEASLFDTARARLSDWTAPVLSQVRQPLVAFEQWVGNLGTIYAVYRENIQLREENAELRKWQDVALSLEDRIRRYETLNNAVPSPELHSIIARVIGESSRPFIKTMILNAGAEQGVQKGEAVLAERGLLGRIYVTGERTSWVILLSDLNSRVPVVIEPSHRRAILIGDNTPAPQLELDVGDGTISSGDRVLSTGDGGLLPPDLPVGVVMPEEGKLKVSLYSDASAADFVRVVDYSVPPPPLASASSPIEPKTQLSKNIPAPKPVVKVVETKPAPPPARTQAAVESAPAPSSDEPAAEAEELDR